MKKYQRISTAGLQVTTIHGAFSTDYVEAAALEKFLDSYNKNWQWTIDRFEKLKTVIQFYATKNRFSVPVSWKALCVSKELDIPIIEFKNETPLRDRLDRHPDEIAIDEFTILMREKMAKSRSKGRNGWDDPRLCTTQALSDSLRNHMEKGDPTDVALFCMMLKIRGSSILKPEGIKNDKN